MDLTLAPVRVLVGEEADGCLVFAGDALAGVLVRLDERYGDDAGQWFLEVGFGRLDGFRHPLFPDVEAARDWIAGRLSQSY